MRTKARQYEQDGLKRRRLAPTIYKALGLKKLHGIVQ